MDRAAVRYDRAGDQHYDVISAFIKCIRGSDADAALHYLARMIEAGEDPRFIARRLIVHASEDVGMADPTALPVAVAAAQAVEFVGLPEARINLAQAVIHLSPGAEVERRGPGDRRGPEDVRAGLAGPVPAHLRDASYRGAARLGHGKGYQYPHDDPEGVVAQAVRAGRGRGPPVLRAVPARGRGQVRRPGRADQGDPGHARPGHGEPQSRRGAGRHAGAGSGGPAPRATTSRRSRAATTAAGVPAAGGCRGAGDRVGQVTDQADRGGIGAAGERRAARGADRGGVLRGGMCAAVFVLLRLGRLISARQPGADGLRGPRRAP